jgi:SAM-dependent methyltransferase
VLTTIGGAADLLAEDLRHIGSSRILQTDGDAVRCRIAGDLADLRAVGTYRSAAVQLGVDALPDLAALHRSRESGVLVPLASTKPIRFRVGCPDAARRRLVIDAVASRTAWENRPGSWDLNITRHRGGWVAEVGYLHSSRRFGGLARRPWSTHPVLAAVLVRMAKITDGHRVHDPCCGTGTLLIAADAAARSLRLSGSDIDPAGLAMARQNLRDRQLDAALRQADAIPFPHPDGSLDRVVSNLPFGKRVGSHGANTRLYPAVLQEIARTLRPNGRAVLLTEDKRLLVETVARTKGIKIIRERLLSYNGATPSAYVLVRKRRS